MPIAGRPSGRLGVGPDGVIHPCGPTTPRAPMLIRTRRLRTTTALRDLVAETDLRARNLIQPHFIQPQAGRMEISSLPGIDRTGVDETLRQVESDLKLGLKSHLLFGVPDATSK